MGKQLKLECTGSGGVENHIRDSRDEGRKTMEGLKNQHEYGKNITFPEWFPDPSLNERDYFWWGIGIFRGSSLGRGGDGT